MSFREKKPSKKLLYEVYEEPLKNRQKTITVKQKKLIYKKV